MTFRNPWAFLGLVAIAGPIVAHLLARRQARRVLFPSLRFLSRGIQRPVSLHRPTNLALLLLRTAIVSLAVVALAQPVWLSTARVERLGRDIARAVIVDSSASMGSMERARAEARRLQGEATAARVVESPRASELIDGAVAWLSSQSMRRELVVVSDFQSGTLARADIDRVPAHIGILMAPVTSAARATTALPGPEESVTLLAGKSEIAAAEAARTAAITQGAPKDALPGTPIAIVFPEYEQRETLLKNARGIDQPWMFESLAGLVTDPMLKNAAARLEHPVSELISPVAGKISDRETLVIVTRQPALSVFTAALVAAAARVADSRRSEAELREGTIPTTELQSWNRPAPETAPSADRLSPNESQGRWLWLGVLALLALEALARRNRRVPEQTKDDAIAA